MSEPRWYHSLYWRIALGLFAFLALMLAAQGSLFLWMTDRIAGSMPARDPRRLAVLVASDVGAALSADPALDLKAYVSEQYSNVFQAFLVIMQDGRVAANHDDLPGDLVKTMIAETERRDFPPRGRRFGPGPPSPGSSGPRPGPPSGSDSQGRRAQPLPGFGAPGTALDGLAPRPPRRGEVATIMVSGMPAGRVAVVPGGAPFSRVVRELGPTMGLVGGGVLGVGMALIAFVIFGPARKRLRHVQDAAERLGGGDFTARVPAGGGDEVAAVARSFNRMAEELTARAEALAASDKARRHLLADVSHELMTPLTAMRGYVETLSMPELRLDEETRRRYLGIVTEETHRLEHIIRDLLDLARLEGGGGTFRPERVDVEWLFDRVAARHERELRERGITLVQKVASSSSQVTGDPDRLEQALQNLAANALRHIDDGGKITLEAAPVFVESGSSGTPQNATAAVCLRVRDSGPGIAPEHLPLIFDRFYKVDAARKAAGGSGLGLSIVKAIVERHGGTIVAYNDAESGGAVFEIVLPAEPH